MFSKRQPPLLTRAAVMFGLSSSCLDLYYHRLVFEGVVRFNVHLAVSDDLGIRLFSIFDPDGNILTFFNILPARAISGRHS